ncbi:MAG: PAS domain S-box protein [Candidatus Thermoplasmatota archaeon]|nr:PAS domain S-box protein [Candidatus Thermoplasmatota archaeon]MBU1940588.1 PAS domain S-box protein [Candidatus Thermoplasmatota archaeon]
MRLRELLIVMSLAISLIPVGIIGGFQGLETTTAFIGLIFVVTFFVSAIISYVITRPLETLTNNIDEISKGNLDVRIDSSEIYEINRLSESLNRVLTSLKLAIHKVGVKKGEIFEETIKAKEIAEEKYNSIIKNLEAWVWELNNKGICTACSAKLTQYLGYSVDEITGKKIHEILPVDHTKQLKTILTDMAQGKIIEPVSLYLNWCHKDGHEIYTKTTFHPIYTENGTYLGIRGIGTDISDLKNAELKISDLTKDLSEMKQRIHTLVSIQQPGDKQVNDPSLRELDRETREDIDHTLFFNEATKIVEADPHFYQKLGYTREEILNMKLSDLEFLESTTDIQNKLNKIKNYGPMKQKSIIRRKDGSSIFVTETLEYIPDQHKYVCLIVEEFSIDKKMRE